MANSEGQSDFGRRLRAGDESVLEAVLRADGPAVRGLLQQKFGGILNAADFEDIVAAALYRVWKYRERFDPQRASLRVWFYRIAANVARDVLRYGWQKARQMEVPCEPIVLASIIDAREEHEETGPQDGQPTGMKRDLREALDLLPDSQRKIVMADAASRDGKVSSQQLSSELGIPAATVRVYRRRAIERLRVEMDRRGWGDEAS
jgi:RNA polymerase sigma-70 factor (ECF subfamily)